MDIKEAILNRRSIRAFTPQPVPREILEDIIETSRWAGSFVNTQPWEFIVLGGPVMQEWKKRILEQYEAGEEEKEEREIYPEMPLPEPYAQRGENFRDSIDTLLFPPGEENLEQKRHAYTISGITVRDAPNAIIVLTEKQFIRSPLPLLALGMIIQNVCLSALNYNLGTCVMGRPVERPRILRELLDIPDSKAIPCVIAIGYPDFSARINRLPRRREPLESWVKWYGF